MCRIELPLSLFLAIYILDTIDYSSRFFGKLCGNNITCSECISADLYVASYN